MNMKIKEYKERTITNEYIQFIQRHCQEIISLTNNDKSLSVCLRDGIIQVYYAGVYLLKIEELNDNNYHFSISPGPFHLSRTLLKKRQIKPELFELYEDQVIPIRELAREKGWIMRNRPVVTKRSPYHDFWVKHQNENKIKDGCLTGSEVDAWILKKYEIRENSSLTDIYKKEPNDDFEFEFDSNNSVQSAVESWCELVGSLKRAVDIYFLTTKAYKEKLFQNTVFRSWPFDSMIPVDLEYNIPALSNPERLGRPDIVGIDVSSGISTLVLVELKYNDHALVSTTKSEDNQVGNSDVAAHIRDTDSLFSKTERISRTFQDVMKSIKIRRDLKLQPDLPNEAFVFKAIRYVLIFGYENQNKEAQIKIKAVIDSNRDEMRKLKNYINEEIPTKFEVILAPSDYDVQNNTIHNIQFISVIL